MAQTSLTYDIDGDTGSLLAASQEEAHGILISKLHERLPDLMHVSLPVMSASDEDIRQIFEEAGLADIVSFKTQIFVGP
ncbi:hypothetical protein QCN27_20115 [Cereibacter sp. SYSU M97828]|nr:hypothetical protein [Cereibacter flavus]